MAVNYTDLFEDVGEFVQRINTFRGWTTSDFATMASQITAELSANGRYDVLNGVSEMIDGWKDSAVGFAQAMSRKIDERLTHRDTIIEQLALSSSAGTSKVLEQIVYDMIAQSKTVNANVVSVGGGSSEPAAPIAGFTTAVPSGYSNAGDTTILVSKVLDGYSGPGRGMAAHPKYLGTPAAPILSELVVPADTLTFVCVRDSEQDGATEGQESWDIVGTVPQTQVYDWRSEGSGSGGTLQTLATSGLIANGEFESWTVTDTPDSWTLSTGAVASTTIFKNTTGANVKRGLASLKILGTAAAEINIYQTMSGLNPTRRYCLGVWIKTSGAGIIAGQLDIQFEAASGYTAHATEKISLNTAALAALTTYALKTFFINLPANLPDDFKLVVKTTGTLTAGQSVYVDGLVFGPVTWHGGLNVVAIAGASKSLRGDRLSVAISNSGEGVFQEFFRRWYGVQLPSKTDASENISDTLATDA